MLEVGLTHEATHLVTPEDSAALVSPLVPAVYASARMIGFAEVVCTELMAKHLAPGQTSVGVGFELSHEAATPIGMKLTMKVKLVELLLQGRKCVFKVEGRDEADRICSGRHERAVIDQGRFLARVAEKARRAGL